MNDEKIIKMLKLGISIRKIAKELGMPHTTLQYQVQNNKKYRLAWNRYKSMVEGMFK